MKKLVIELSDKQHRDLMRHIENGRRLDLEHETFSGFSINVVSPFPGVTDLEVENYGHHDLGSVQWHID